MTSIELRAEYESLYLHHYVDEDAYISFEDWLLLFIEQRLMPKLSKELSDEEIEIAQQNAWSDYEYQQGNLYSTTFRDGWLMAIKWYREQQKQK